MRTPIAGLRLAGAIVLFAATASAAEKAVIDFEIVMEAGLPPTAAQEWMQLFKGLDQSGVRIRSATGGDRPDIAKQDLGGKVRYKVVGVLRGNNTLIVPGGSFGRNDKAQLRQWIEKLRDTGVDSIGEKEGAFGLLSKHLVEVHEKLGVPVSFSTSGRPPREVVAQIQRGLKIELVFEAGTEDALQEADPFADDLNGLTAGTALAAALRPAGLALVPERTRGEQPRLRVVDARDAMQSWPIGWPLKKPATETVPKLLEFLSVEIDNTPLAEALPAIQERLGVPFLYDYNGLARNKVELDKVLVTLPVKRTYYAKLLDRILAKANLGWEVRQDERDQTFIWISPKR